MGSRRNSLISLVTFSSTGSKKVHNKAEPSPQKSVESTGSFSDPHPTSDTPLSSSTHTTSSGELLSQMMLDAPPRLKLKPCFTTLNGTHTQAIKPAISMVYPRDLRWELLHEVICGVSPEYPEFFAIYVDSTKSWYRGYLFQSDSAHSKMVPFAVKLATTLGESARTWLLRQPCNKSLEDSVRIVSLEWLFAIPDQRLSELEIVRLIEEIRRVRDPNQCVRFMNRVNSVLGLPQYSRTHDGLIMSVGSHHPSKIVETQMSAISPALTSQAEEKLDLEQWLPRDLEVRARFYESESMLDQCLVKMHLRQVTPQGISGERLSENYEAPLEEETLNLTFKHLLPSSPSHAARFGRAVLVCEIHDLLTSQLIGASIINLDLPLQPESLGRTYVAFVAMYKPAGQAKAQTSSLYKGLISGGATGLKISKVIKEMKVEITPKLRSRSSSQAVRSTVKDHLNLEETVLVDVGKLVILKKPSLLKESPNDPVLIKIEGIEHVAIPDNDIGANLKFGAPSRHIDIQLLNGSTVVATSKAASREIPVAAKMHRVPLFDTEKPETLVGFVNIQQTYLGSQQLQPPPVVSSIIEGSIDFDPEAVSELGLLDLRIWASSLITGLLTRLVEVSDTKDDGKAQQLFKAFVKLLILGLPRESRYLFQLYTPPRRLLAAPVASVLLQQYSALFQKEPQELSTAFRAHVLLGRLLDVFSVSPSEFSLITQEFMTFFTDTRMPQSLIKTCLKRVDELYLVNTCPEVTSQIGSVLRAASHISIQPNIVDFYWLLTRVARSGSYRTIFSQQYSSLILSLTETFWKEAGTQPTEEIRALMALIKAISSESDHALAFLALCMGVLITYEPSFRASPTAPLFEPHEAVSASTETELTTAILETSLVIFDLTGQDCSASRSFLRRLEAPLDFIYQLCLCAEIMADSFVPKDWASLNLVLLQCALRCTEYAAGMLELIAMPESAMEAGSLNKEVWKRVFLTIFSIIADPRVNYGVTRLGDHVSPLQRVGIEQSLLESGAKIVDRLWRGLAKGAQYGGYQVQFYEEYDLWGYVMLLGANAELHSVCRIFSNMLESLINGERKLYWSMNTEPLRVILLSMDHMFRHLNTEPYGCQERGETRPEGLWPGFESASLFMEGAFGQFAVEFLREDNVLANFDTLRTYWSEPYSREALLSLWEAIKLLKEFQVYEMFEKYFEEFVDAVRTSADADERLAVAYFEVAQIYSSAQENTTIRSTVSPRLPPQTMLERRKSYIELSLQHCRKAQSWKLAETILDTESYSLKELGRLEDRSSLVTKWLPVVTAGLTHGAIESEHNWYLIRFHGKGLGVLSEREYIWERKVQTRLSDAIETLSAMFNNISCLPWDSPPKSPSPGPYISVLTLVKEDGRFAYLKPLLDQRTELTRLETVTDIPSPTGFIEVSGRHTQILSTAATALRDICRKTEELRAVCTPRKFRQLDLVLSGILNAGVNGGIGRYSQLLGGGDRALIEAYRNLKEVVEDALAIYDQQCGEELRGQYNLLQERARQWQSLVSTEAGFL